MYLSLKVDHIGKYLPILVENKQNKYVILLLQMKYKIQSVILTSLVIGPRIYIL